MARQEIPKIDPVAGNTYLELVQQTVMLEARSHVLKANETALMDKLCGQPAPPPEEYGAIAQHLREAKLASKQNYVDLFKKTEDLLTVASDLSGGLVTVTSIDPDRCPITQLSGLPYTQTVVGRVAVANGQIANRAGLERFSNSFDLEIIAPKRPFHKPQSFRAPLFDGSGQPLVTVTFNQ